MPKKSINGSPLARAIFAGCPAMTKLGSAAATLCAQQKITNRDELRDWLSDNANVQLVLKSKNCGFGTVRDLFAAVGLPSPFDNLTPPPQPNVSTPNAADLLQQLADLRSRHYRLAGRVDGLTAENEELKEQLADLSRRHDHHVTTIDHHLSRLSQIEQPATDGPGNPFVEAINQSDTDNEGL